MTLRQLFWIFFKISATAFGGGIAVIGVTKQEMAVHGNLSEEELSNFISLATAMPGPLAVSIAYLIGRHYHQTLGATVGILGAALPRFFSLSLSPLLYWTIYMIPLFLVFFEGF
jgi:Chromate transport protein ChrA